jgi:hypothetical protein
VQSQILDAERPPRSNGTFRGDNSAVPKAFDKMAKVSARLNKIFGALPRRREDGRIYERTRGLGRRARTKRIALAGGRGRSTIIRIDG